MFFFLICINKAHIPPETVFALAEQETNNMKLTCQMLTIFNLLALGLALGWLGFALGPWGFALGPHWVWKGFCSYLLVSATRKARIGDLYQHEPPT